MTTRSRSATRDDSQWQQRPQLGSVARSTCDLDVTVHGIDPILETTEAREPHGGCVEAAAVVLDLNLEAPSLATEVDVDAIRSGVLDGVGQGLRYEEIRGAFQLGRQARMRRQPVGVNLDRDGQPHSPLGDRLEQPAVGEDRGMDAAGQLLQVLERSLGVALRVAQRLFGQIGIALELVSRQAKPGEHANQFLLNTVVQVSLETSPA